MNKIDHHQRPTVIYLSARRFRADPEAGYADLQNNYYLMIVMISGRLETVFASGRVMVEEGDVQLLPAGFPYRQRTFHDAPMDGYIILFNWSQDRVVTPQVRHDRHGLMELLAKRLVDNTPPADATRVQACSYLVSGLLGEFLSVDRPDDDPLVSKLRSYVAAHIKEPLTLDRLAEHVNLNKHYLVRRYRRAAGCSPMEDVRRLRVARARHLAITTEAPVKHIAADVGINDASYLSRLFRRYYHTTIRDVRL